MNAAYLPLGRTGMWVSRLCLGTMMFGALGNTDRNECARIIGRALDAGINFIDTADIYGAGESEEILGETLATSGRRDELILATKFYNSMGPGLNHSGGSRRWIMRAVEGSLRRLRTDYIDLYQMHRPDIYTDFEETLGALTDLVQQGKVRSVGSSTFPASQIVEAQWAAKDQHATRFVTEQAPYSLLVRAVEADVLPTLERHRMSAIVWSPLAGGWLSGAFSTRGTIPSTVRMKRKPEQYDFSRPDIAAKLRAAQDLGDLAEEIGMSLIHLALAFVLRHPVVTSAIIGPRTIDHLESMLGALDIELDEATLDRIDEIVLPGQNVSPLDGGFRNPWLQPEKRRRPFNERPLQLTFS